MDDLLLFSGKFELEEVDIGYNLDSYVTPTDFVQAARNSDLIEKLEDVVEIWCRQIDQVGGTRKLGGTLKVYSSFKYSTLLCLIYQCSCVTTNEKQQKRQATTHHDMLSS